MTRTRACVGQAGLRRAFRRGSGGGAQRGALAGGKRARGGGSVNGRRGREGGRPAGRCGSPRAAEGRRPLMAWARGDASGEEKPAWSEAAACGLLVPFMFLLSPPPPASGPLFLTPLERCVEKS